VFTEVGEGMENSEMLLFMPSVFPGSLAGVIAILRDVPVDDSASRPVTHLEHLSTGRIHVRISVLAAPFPTRPTWGRHRRFEER
jgi:hypothetical protein